MPSTRTDARTIHEAGLTFLMNGSMNGCNDYSDRALELPTSPYRTTPGGQQTPSMPVADPSLGGSRGLVNDPGGGRDTSGGAFASIGRNLHG